MFVGHFNSFNSLNYQLVKLIMKTVSVKQMIGLDEKAIRDYGIPGIVLMENAGLRSADFIAAKFKKKPGFKVLVVCGRGNNGGDGFVVARHLSNRGYDVLIVVLAAKSDIFGDALVNLNALVKMKAKIAFLGSGLADMSFVKQVKKSNLVIDAIFGIGLKREIVEPLKSCITFINNLRKSVVSLDVPSGLNADTGEVLGAAIKAGYTLTMGFAKKGLFIRQGPASAGKVQIIDIGLPRSLK